MNDEDKRFDNRVPFAAGLLVVRDDAAWRAEPTDLSTGGCGAFRPEAAWPREPVVIARPD